MANTPPRSVDPATAALADVFCEARAEALWVLKRAALYDMGDWVELHCSRLAAEPRRFKRDRAATGEQIEHTRRVAPIGGEHEGPRFGDDAVGGAPAAERSKELF